MIIMRLKFLLIRLALILSFAPIIIPINRVSAAPPTSPVWVQSDYWFRDDDGGEITATGLGDGDITKNGAVGINDSNDYGRKRVFRIRIGFRVQQADGTIKPRLEFRESQTNDCSGTDGWQAIGTGATTRYILRDSPNLTNGALTTQQITGGQFVSGKFLDTENPPTTAQTVTKNYRTEYEWSVEDTTLNFTQNKNYLFRITDNGTPLDSYLQCPILNFSKTNSYSGGQPTEIRFSGHAYPDAKITVFAKNSGANSLEKIDEIKSPDGNFKVSYTGIIPNVYNYSLVIEDKGGRTSQVKSYNLDVYANSLSARDILAPPTLGLSKSTAAKGDLLTALGYASPGNTVEVEIDNGIVSGKAKTDGDGQYKLTVNTDGLSFGNHRLRARQSDYYFKTSDWSPTVLFDVSKLSNLLTDYNNDGIINISDLSIFLSGWAKTDEKIRKQLDLNKDGKTDISDFSIFIRNIKK